MKPHKHATIIKAWADGGIVQYYSIGGEWKDCVGNNPTWQPMYKYRIKPEKDVTRNVKIELSGIVYGDISYCFNRDSYAFVPLSSGYYYSPAVLLIIMDTIKKLNKECLNENS